MATCPPAFPHQQITEIFPDVYLVRGSIRMGPGLRMNRNMVVIRDSGELSLINPVRMNTTGLEQLEQLGRVKRIIRLGDFHGLDDPFYLDRYQCEFWAQPNQHTYPQPSPTHTITSDTPSPITNTEFFIFTTARYPEAALLVKKHKLLITTDSVQYYSDWLYFSLLTRIAFRLLGFKPGMNIGPPWLKFVTPKGQSMRGDFEQLLQLDFDALIAAHGTMLNSGAKLALKNVVKNVLR